MLFKNFIIFLHTRGLKLSIGLTSDRNENTIMWLLEGKLKAKEIQ